jgi:PKD repeat protein
MGDQDGARDLSPDQIEAYRRQIEEFEILGVPTEELHRVLAERPQDFERVAAALLAREFQTPSPDAVPAEPVESISPQVQASPESLPAEAPEPQVEPAPAIEGDASGPIEPPAGEPTPAGAPEPEFIEPQPTPEATLAEALPIESAGQSRPTEPNPDDLSLYLGEAAPPSPEASLTAADFAAPGPEPTALEESPDEVRDLEASIDREIEEAVAGTHAAQDEAPPPLSSGDSLSVSARPPPRPPAPRPGAKPPPPRVATRVPGPAGAAARKPQKVMAVRVKGAPPGAKPAPVPAGPPASEVLPVEEQAGRRWGPAVVGAVVLLAVFAGTYVLLGNAAPSAVFTVAPAAPEAGQLIVFDASNSSDPNGDPLTFSWAFGDGANATGKTAIHQYARSGNYRVVLTVLDSKQTAASNEKLVAVAPGHIDVPVYRYGDRADYTVSGQSRVDEASPSTPLATFTISLGGQEQQCTVSSVNGTFTGTQYRLVEPDPASALNGFLDENETYVLDRHVDVIVRGDIQNDCQLLHFSGNTTAHQQDYQNLASNDTVRSETDASSKVTITNAQPPKSIESRAHMIDYPRLSNVSEQLHFEDVYSGRSFSTEDPVGGNFTAEGYQWSWITQGTSLIEGQLAIKLHFTIPARDFKISQLYVALWVSAASSLPLKEEFFIHGIEPGKQYESLFTATVSGTPTVGDGAIPFGNKVVSYRTLGPGEATPLTEVPRASAGPDFAFTPRQAYDEAYANVTDFRNFMTANPQAYAVNATYGRNAGNPKWTIDFAKDNVSETMRVEDEHSTSTVVTTSAGQDGAERTRGQMGNVVTLNYAAGLIALEQQGIALFPSGTFDAAHANFTVRTELKLPTLSLSGATAATRRAVAYAYGGESFDTQPVRVTAYVDAQTGQLVYSLRESGDSLP